nr:4-hydroxythreonine-4-phosphate dehydrogenase PdxA [Flavobacteriales bacterium]
WKKFDAVMAMYHDQGLVPFKSIAFHHGVNFTAGLPVIRTSPDHGTGYDIAGKDLASPDSFREAIYTAIDIFRNRKQYQEMSSNPLQVMQRRERERDRHA